MLFPSAWMQRTNLPFAHELLGEPMSGEKKRREEWEITSSVFKFSRQVQVLVVLVRCWRYKYIIWIFLTLAEYFTYSAGTYPWFARPAQGTGVAESDDFYGCGGSLISAEYVLSAAHCIHLFNTWDGFRIGALCHPYTSGNNCGQATEYFSVQSSTSHPNYIQPSLPNYNQTGNTNDLVLVRLNGSSSITPVDIDSANISNSYSDGKGNLWTIGLGSTSTPTFGYSMYTDHLKHVELKYVSNQSCCTTYDWPCSEITSTKMCATDPGQDTCGGDSGGPLYDSSSQKLVGVVSYGEGK